MQRLLSAPHAAAAAIALAVAAALAPLGPLAAQAAPEAPSAAPAAASVLSPQEQLDARYNRALAAGYKALFLCSATANAERLGATRSPESIHQWELTGVDPAFDPIIRDLPYEILRRSGEGTALTPVDHVRVPFAQDMPARIAVHLAGEGCFLQPIGAPVPEVQPLPADYAPAAIPPEPWRAAPAELARSEGERLAAGAFDGTYGKGARTTGVVIIKDGAIVLERYAAGFDANTPQRTWSVAKSIAATLVGAAALSSEHAVSDPIGINYWRSGGAFDARGAITIDHALRMASGRYSDTPGNRTDPIYWGGATVDERASHWPVIHPPGTVFRYANNDILMAIKGIGSYLEFYPAREVLARFGMHRTIAETDWRGNYVLSSQVWATARDLARLGQLHLDDGVVEGADGRERVLPEDWRGYITAPSGPQPEGPFGYGAGWWLMNASPGVPPDTFAAMGNRGQYVVVVPSRKVVIVRRGEDRAGAGFDIAAFTRDALAALAER